MSVDQMPYEDEVITMLRSLWTPARVVRYLRFRYGDEGLTAEDITRVKERMPEASFIRPSKLAEQGDVKIDTLMAMSRLLLNQEEQVSAATLAAEQNPEDSAAQRATAKATKQYWNMLVEFSEIMQSVGELPKVGAKRGEEETPPVQPIAILLGDLRPKELGPGVPQQSLTSPREDAREAGIIEGEYEEVVQRPERASVADAPS